MAHRSILTPLTNQLVPLWLHSLPLQSSLSSSLLSLLSAPSSASSATTAAHGLGSASSARIYDCTAARVGSSSSFGGATNPGYRERVARHQQETQEVRHGVDPRVLAVVAQPVGTGGPACGLPRPPPPISSPQVTPRPPRRGRPARRLRSKHGAAGRSVMLELGLTEVRQASAGTNWWPLYRNARRLYSC